MNDKKITPIVNQQVPFFIREDSELFSSFLEAYYEWVETQYGIISPSSIGDAPDVDESVDLFVEFFTNQYLNNFPIDLAKSADGNDVSKEALIKNIRDFYQTKGTEASYKFLFNLVFGVDVSTYLPKTDILIASGSEYIRQSSIKVTNSLGDDIFKATNQIITQIDSTNGQTKAKARVERIILTREGSFDIAELYINNIEGNFEVGLPIRFSFGGELFEEIYTYSVITNVNVSTAGTGYQVGDTVNITYSNSEASGVGATAEVSRVGNDGDIKSVRIINSGVGYDSMIGVSVGFTRNDITDSSYIDAVGSASVGVLNQYEGFYESEAGHLSVDKVLQDNVYYQPYSYVLKSEIVISRYKELVKNLVHPSGFAFFGAVEIFRCFEENLSTENEIRNYKFPVIGNYTPYTFETSEDLDDDYPNGFFSDIIGATLASSGNPDGDPFWPIFEHFDEGTQFKDIVIGEFIKQDAGYTHTCTNLPQSSLNII